MILKDFSITDIKKRNSLPPAIILLPSNEMVTKSSQLATKRAWECQDFLYQAISKLQHTAQTNTCMRPSPCEDYPSEGCIQEAMHGCGWSVVNHSCQYQASVITHTCPYMESALGLFLSQAINQCFQSWATTTLPIVRILPPFSESLFPERDICEKKDINIICPFDITKRPFLSPRLPWRIIMDFSCVLRKVLK